MKRFRLPWDDFDSRINENGTDNFLSNIKSRFNNIQRASPYFFSRFCDLDELVIFSDYSGTRSTPTYSESYSFVLTSRPDSFYFAYRAAKHNLENKVKGYYEWKDSDPVKVSKEMQFLGLCDDLPMLFFSVTVNNSIDSLFSESNLLELAHNYYKTVANIDASLDTLEKQMRISLFLSFLLAGFSAESQKVTWIPDRDPSTQNDEIISVMGHLLSGAYRLFRGVEKKNITVVDRHRARKQEEELLEHLNSLPDLIAGASRFVYENDLIQGYTTSEKMQVVDCDKWLNMRKYSENENGLLTPDEGFNQALDRALNILQWICDNTTTAKKISFHLFASENDGKVSVNWKGF